MYAIDLALQWDPQYLQLIGKFDNTTYNPPNGWLLSYFPDQDINDTWTDGTALYSALTQLGVAAEATVGTGLRIVTFRFQTLDFFPDAGAGSQGAIVYIKPCLPSGPPGMMDDIARTRVDGAASGLLQGVLGTANVRIRECFTTPQCDDGLWCTGAEICTLNTCTHPTPPCADTNPCTDDICNEGPHTCNHVVDNTNDPDDGLWCNGVQYCQNGAVQTPPPPDCTDTNPCTTDSCSEALRACVFNNNTNPCNDNQLCTSPDVCNGGLCQGTPIPGCQPCDTFADCNDGISCTADNCSGGPGGMCVHTAQNDLCPEDGLFCNGEELCSATSGCYSAGPPCGGCTEQAGCPCATPLVENVGSRYIKVIPQPPESTLPQAIRIELCNSSVFRYVGFPGTTPCGAGPICPFNINGDAAIEGSLGYLKTDSSQATFASPAQWLGAIYITGADLLPNHAMVIRADCGTPGAPVLSQTASMTTRKYGDVDGSGLISFADILRIVQNFQANYTNATKPATDLDPCTPQQVVNFADVLKGVKAFQASPFTEFCSSPCQ